MQNMCNLCLQRISAGLKHMNTHIYMYLTITYTVYEQVHDVIM